MRVLVTGSEGSLMQATIPLLQESGHLVMGVDNFFRYGKLERKRNYEFVEGDLTDPDLADSLCRQWKPDVIFQAAARIFGVGGFHKFPADILSHDVSLTQNVLWSALKQGVSKVVYISSSMVYERCTTVPSREEDVDDMLIPRTDYGLSKLMGERLCRAFQRQYGLCFTVWRPFNIITPYERGGAEAGISHVFADFIRRIIVERQNPMEILGDGEQVRCFTWIEDVARAIATHSFGPKTDAQTYNLGNPEAVTMKELARRIYAKGLSLGLIRESGELAFRHRTAFEDDVRVRIPCVEKARRELGWAPRVLLDQALDECVRA